MKNKSHQARVRWHCRRGMLELDVLLFKFFDQHYDQLNLQERETFEKLLECTDQDLFGWLVKQENPADASLQQMVERIRLR